VSRLLASRQLRAARYGSQHPWRGEWAPTTLMRRAARCAHARPANLKLPTRFALSYQLRAVLASGGRSGPTRTISGSGALGDTAEGGSGSLGRDCHPCPLMRIESFRQTKISQSSMFKPWHFNSPTAASTARKLRPEIISSTRGSGNAYSLSSTWRPSMVCKTKFAPRNEL